MAMPTVLEQLASVRDAVRVLLVEDNPGDRRLVQEMLREVGSDSVLTSCDRVSAALDPLQRGLADLVLLDLSLPDAHGLEGLRRLRAAAPEVPVVVLSGNSSDELALEAVQAGAQDYLIKGNVDGSTLTRAMRYAVERQRAERRLARLALRDPLTGLPNRVLFADRLEQALARSGRHPDELALMFIDLDGFKEVNDRLGHLAGDEVLIEVGRRLRSELRSADTVARLGGDEFVVLCDEMADDAAAVALAKRLNEVLSEPYATAAGEAILAAAIGVAIAEVEEEAGALLRRADTAMYAAKRAGPGRTHLASR
jgi:diguanylate cyclase (GGDEF)-like protein